MLVSQLLSEARKRLITIGAEALLIDAARSLSDVHSELVIVCNSHGKAIGAITKADVVRRITHCEGAACRMMAAAAMTWELISCRPDVRDALQALLTGAENERNCCGNT